MKNVKRFKTESTCLRNRSLALKSAHKLSKESVRSKNSRAAVVVRSGVYKLIFRIYERVNQEDKSLCKHIAQVRPALSIQRKVPVPKTPAYQISVLWYWCVARAASLVGEVKLLCDPIMSKLSLDVVGQWKLFEMIDGSGATRPVWLLLVRTERTDEVLHLSVISNFQALRFT